MWSVGVCGVYLASLAGVVALLHGVWRGLRWVRQELVSIGSLRSCGSSRLALVWTMGPMVSPGVYFYCIVLLPAGLLIQVSGM